MAKMSLLAMTQNILSSMNSDEVDSITDTVESQQVAEEIRNTFFDLYSNRDIAELQSLINLETSSDTTRPNTLVLPDNVDRLKWIKYFDFRGENNPGFRIIKYLDPEEFISRIAEQGVNDFGLYLTVPLTNTSSVQYTINAQKCPDYYTVLDNDNTLVFDSVDVSYESNLSGSRALAWGYLSPQFELTDDFIPAIDSNLFPHFLAEAKSACFVNIKETANSKEEQRARRQLVRSQFRTDKTTGQRKGIFSGTDFARHR